ncbi:MAG: DUF2341 domain-containing protein [Desulfobulbaceae bacterium]|nr:DUF2341 domain-containing protein [Desulfobulbaceae bacterium]
MRTTYRLKHQLIIYCLAVLALLGSAAFSDAADIFVWQFKDSQPGIQEARSSTVDSHGNLIISGYSDEAGDDDFYTIKLSSDGQTVLWSARYAHPQGDDWAWAVAVDSLDNVIVTGNLFNGINDDIAVIKYDGETGAEMWAAPFILNGTANGNDLPLSMAIDALNNIYIAGYSQSGGSTADDGILIKISPQGTKTWQFDFNGAASGEDRFTTVSVGAGGVMVGGFTKVLHTGNRLDFDYLTIKLGYDGYTLWQKSFDNGYGDDVGGYSGMDSAGNVIVTGEALASGSRHDMVTIKYAAADGQQQWLTTYSAGSPNIPRGLVVDSDDEVYVTGNTFTLTGKDDFYTARYAGANGTPVWQKVFDSGTNNTDVPHALAVDNTGGLYVTGYTHKAATQDDDFQTLKYNKDNGNLIWQRAEDGPSAGGNEQPVGVAVALSVSADGNIYVGGWSQQGNDLDYFAVKYSANLLNAPTGLNATVVSQTRIDLSWADNSNTPNNEDSFCVERCQGFACADFTELTCAVPQNQTTYTDSTVSRDNWYSYRVKGKHSLLGFSLPTNTASTLSTLINYPAPNWLYTHDGDGLDDQANAIAMGSDNNPVATGTSTNPNSQFDYYTVKFDRTNAAIPLWIDDYDGPDGQGDMAICLALDSTNAVIVSGFSSMNDGQGGNTNDIFTIKYAADGPDIHTGYPLWTSQYNGPGNDDDRTQAVAAASDGSDYTVVTGYGKNAAANEDIYLIKYKPDYDVAGQQVWAITPFDRGFDDRPITTAFTPAGDVVVVGTTERAPGDSDVFISLYRGSDGAVVSGWPYIHDFGYGIDGIDAVAVGPDNSIYVAGFAKNAAGNLDVYINKLNSAGVSQWSDGKLLDGAGHGYDRASAIALDPNDGEVIVAATMTSASGSRDFVLLRYTATGTLLWQKTLDLIAHDEFLTSMAVSPSGEVCLVGETDNNTDNDVIAVKYDHLGNLIGSTKYDSGFDDYATDITVNRLGEFYISGYSATGPLATDDFDFVVFRFNGQELQAPSPFTTTTHNTTVDLSWTENDPAVSGYKLYRKTGSCTAGGTTFAPTDLIYTATPGTTAYTNSNLNIGSTYCYGVQTYRLATSEISRIIEKQVTTTIPVPPNNLVATLKNTSEVEVCWHDNSASEDGFAVQRCTGVNCDFSQYTTLFAPAELDPLAVSTCLTDTTACDAGAGKNFRYRVQSYRVNAWNSTFSPATGTITVPGLLAPSALLSTKISDASVALQWTDNTVDESDFVVERCQGAGCSNFSEIAAVSAVTGNNLLLEMDETAWTGAAGEISDYSGKNFNATGFGGPTTTADSHQGRAASLDGTNDYLTSPLSINQSSSSTGVTMMAWVKLTSTSSGQHFLFSTEDGTASQLKNSWGLLRDGSTWKVATGEAVRSTGVAVSSGVWQHLAVVFAPGTGVKFYKNGTEVYINYIGTHDSSTPLTIGRQGILNQNFFDGLVDEAAVFSRALTAAEIQKLYSRGVFPESTGQKWFTDSTVLVNTDYQYRITARKQTSCGTDLSPASNIISLTTTPPPPQPLTATQIKPGVIALTWTPQTTTHNGFVVERCNGSGCSDFTAISSAIGPTVKKYSDSTACYGSDGVNRYRIKALGSWGESAPSAVAETVSVPSPIPAGLDVSHSTEASVKLQWTYSDSTQDGFTIERCDGDQATCAQSNAFSEIAISPFSGQDSATQAIWHFDDSSWNGTAGEVADSSGQNHHGTAMNGLILDSPGVSSYGAALFDGVNDYISTDLMIDQSATTSGATFMAWVYITDQSSRWQQVFSTDNGGYDWGLRFFGGAWYVSTGATTYWAANNDPANTWQHVAVVFDPSYGFRFYKNSVLQANVANLELDASSAPFTIGRHATEGNYFAGKMDEVVVLNRPMTGTEIIAYYNHSTPIVAVDAMGINTGSTYTYRVKPFVNSICGDWGQNASSAEATATTPATPMAPDTLTVTQKGSTELDLSWHSNTASESAFVIERCQGSGCDFSTHDSFQTGPGVTTYQDKSVCQGQTYRYRVQAVKDGAAPEEWPTAFTTAVEKSTAVANPVTLTLNVINEAEIDLSWNDVNQDEDAYELSRCVVDPGVVACDQPAQFTVLNTYPGSVTGALLHYRMNEAAWSGVSNEVLDASGNNRHGIGYTGATTVPDGRFDRAGSFNGTTAFVYTPLNSSLLPQTKTSPGVTMEAWVYPTLNDTNPRSVFSTDNGGYDWGVTIQNGKWYVNTGLSQYDTGLTVDYNSWQHIAAVFTPMTGITFYKNMESVPISEIDYDTSFNQLNIGRNANSSDASYYFKGKIDEVMVYGRPLTATEIAKHNTAAESPAYSFKDSGLQHSTSYFYKVTAQKAASCAWNLETTQSRSTPAPPPPTNLRSTLSDSTSCTLAWNDNNGSETSYVVSRCEGVNGDCASPVLTNLAANSTSFTDNSLCPQITYTYRVWATGQWGQTTFAELGMTTQAQAAAPTNLAANLVSEVEIDVSWNNDPAASDETGITLTRCTGAACVDFTLPPGTSTYADNELVPNTEYCYQVSAYKTATCPWQTTITGPICATTNPNSGGLIATPTSTTTVDLAWNDNAQTETTSIVERCDGDLSTCCNGDPAACSGTFSPIKVLGANQHNATDDSPCVGNVYTYRINTSGEGLTQANGGCWTKRAPLTFSSFPAAAGVEVVIPYQPAMKPDFSDIRFYDATAHRELQFWLKQKTDSTSATVWLMTGANPAIYLYYGNANAKSASATDALFTEIYDTFQGTAINPAKWVEIDAFTNKISQNNGLQFVYKDTTQDAAIISTKTFERAAGNELFIDFTVGTDVIGRRDELFFLGWEKDQTTLPTWSGNAAHLLEFTSNGNHYLQYAREDVNAVYMTKVLYNDLTRYQVKIVLNAESGAKYYLKGGIYPDWRLLTESTYVRANDDILRVAFHQASHNITIHQVSVKHASAQRGVTVNFASAEGDGVACLPFSHTWVGASTLAAQALLPAIATPAGLAASIVDGKVRLTWNAGTNDETEFLIERNCGAGFVGIATTPAGTLSYNDLSMPASTSCSYQVKGHKVSPCPWTSAPSAAVQILAPPAAPIVTATATNAFQIRLDWSDAADEVGYDIEAQVFSGGWMPVATLPANQISYTDSHGVNPNSQYIYRVRARRLNDSSAWGQATATTPAYTPGAATCPLP